MTVGCKRHNVYLLKEGKEECHLSKYDERWIWHMRHVHLNFDHIINFVNNAALKYLPKISKPYDFVCNLIKREIDSHTV